MANLTEEEVLTVLTGLEVFRAAPPKRQIEFIEQLRRHGPGLDEMAAFFERVMSDRREAR